MKKRACNTANFREDRRRYIRVVRELQFLNNFQLKKHFCRALAPKNARLVREPTGFPNKSIDFCDRLALRRLLPQRGGKIADVCGGFGRLTDEYIGRYAQAFLFDYAPKLLEQAKAAYGSRLRIVQGSVYAMPFEAGEFDALVMVRAAHHLTDLNAAVAEIARVLKSGGIAVIELANKRSLAEITRRFCGRSALHPFSLEPESCSTTGFYYFHPRYAERIFERNGLRVKKTLAVTGIRRNIRTKFFAPLLYALEYLLQYVIGGFKWSPSLYYLLVRE